jgi:hypothetical protein
MSDPPASRFAALPPLADLLTWVHRPQAIAKCLVSDVYNMPSLAVSGVESVQRFSSRGEWTRYWPGSPLFLRFPFASLHRDADADADAEADAHGRCYRPIDAADTGSQMCSSWAASRARWLSWSDGLLAWTTKSPA